MGEVNTMVKRRAQSILEYVIVLSAIVVAVIAAAAPDGPIRRAVDNMFADSAKLIEDRTTDFLSGAATNPR